MSDPFDWLPTDAGAAEPDDDPWADLDVPTVDLTAAQRDFLAARDDLPAAPRMRDLADPIAPFEERDEPGNLPTTGETEPS